MIQRTILIILVILFLNANITYAGIYGDLDLFGGYTGTTVSAGATAPTLLQAGAGATLGLNFSDFIFGLSSDYRFINQYSTPTSDVGNRHGTRWNIASPTLGVMLGSFLLKADFQFLGNYNLGALASDGGTISCTNPMGYRVVLAYDFFSPVYIGAFYESVSFSNQNDSVSGNTTLSPTLQLWQAGLYLTTVLFE